MTKDELNKIRVRLFDRVKKTRGCWNWTGHTNNHGYGGMRVNGKQERVHRISYMVHHGKKPTKWVLHHCDNRRCVKPDHLYEGDRSDNMRDMKDRKRHPLMRRKACVRGHVYKKGSYVYRRGQRFCIECNKVYTKRWWSKNKEWYNAQRNATRAIQRRDSRTSN